MKIQMEPQLTGIQKAKKFGLQNMVLQALMRFQIVQVFL